MNLPPTSPANDDNHDGHDWPHAHGQEREQLLAMLEAERALRRDYAKRLKYFEALENTDSVKTVRRWWTFQASLFPHQKRRTALYQKAKKALNLLTTQGPRALVDKLQGKNRGKTALTIPFSIKRQAEQRVQVLVHITSAQVDAHILHQAMMSGWVTLPPGYAKDDFKLRWGFSEKMAETRLLWLTEQVAHFEVEVRALPAGQQTITIYVWNTKTDEHIATSHVDLTVLGQPYVLPSGATFQASDLEYQHFIDRFEKHPRELLEQHAQASQWALRPLIMIFTTVTTLTVDQAVKMYLSLQGQTYTEWQWYLFCPPEKFEEFQHFRDFIRFDEAQIHVTLKEDSSSLEAMRKIVERGAYAYLLPLPENVFLHPTALFEWANAVRLHPEAVLYYGDHDQLTSEGLRHSPSFKPDWSPQLLLSTPYIGDCALFQGDYLLHCGGFTEGISQRDLWKLYLQFVREGKTVSHIPKVLSHHLNSSPALGFHALDLIQDHLKHLHLAEPQVVMQKKNHIRVEWRPAQSHFVSVIIPTRNISLVQPLINALMTRIDFENLEVIVVYTGEDKPSAETAFSEYTLHERFKLVYYTPADGYFNYHDANHVGVEAAQGNLFLFMNDDIEILDPQSIRRMVQWFDLEQVGVVGPKLLFPDGKIQHAGVIFGLDALASHVFLGQKEDVQSMWGSDEWYRNLSVVTAGCMMVGRSAFEKVGGFDNGYILHFGDVDLGMRLSQSGYQVIYTPDVKFIHHESTTTRLMASGIKKFYRNDWDRFGYKWLGALSQSDPFYNPNLAIFSLFPTYRTEIHPASIYFEERLHHLPEGDIFSL